MKQEYKQNPPPGGIFQVKNLVSGKILVGKCTNSHGALDRERFSLNTGGHRSRELQQDWNRLGPDCFSFELLEVLERDKDPKVDYAGELDALLELWLERLEPYGEKGYNPAPRIK